MKKKVMITGATRGIGREAVRQLCARGFTVFATGRDEDLLESLKKETGCLGAVCDLTEAREVVSFYEKAHSALGQIDVLINNAGFNPGKKAMPEVSVEDMDASYAVNFRACFILAREALREMSARRSGHIVNVISTVARTSLVNYSAYSAMKYALHGFTQCLIKEARESGVKVTGVYPGGVDTDFRAEERPDYMRADSAAAMIVQCITAPEDVIIHELVYRPMVESNF